MSKIGDDNKSGKVLANVIIDEMEEGKEFSNTATAGRDYEKILIRNFANYFISYYELATGECIAFGSMSDKAYDKLKEELKRIAKEYYLDEICVWMKVSKWQDLFPTDFSCKDEMKFKEDFINMIYELHAYILNEKNKQSDSKKNDNEGEYEIQTDKHLLRKRIFELMKADYEISNGCKISSLTEKTLKSIRQEYEAKGKSGKEEKRTIPNKLKEELEARRKAKEKLENSLIRKYIDSEDFPQEYNLEQQEFVELFDWCKKEYKEEKVDLNNDDTFEKWMKEQREKIKENRKKETQRLYEIDKKNGYISF